MIPSSKRGSTCFTHLLTVVAGWRRRSTGFVILLRTEVQSRSLAFGTLCSSQGAACGPLGFQPVGHGFRALHRFRRTASRCAKYRRYHAGVSLSTGRPWASRCVTHRRRARMIGPWPVEWRADGSLRCFVLSTLEPQVLLVAPEAVGRAVMLPRAAVLERQYGRHLTCANRPALPCVLRACDDEARA